MKHTRRILLEVFLPPLLGAAIFSVLMVASRRDWRAVSEIPLLFGLAYLYAIIPSIVYAVLLEVIFFAGVSAASWKSVLFSSAFGVCAGVSIVMTINSGGFRFVDSFPMAVVGAVVGFAVGAIIRHQSMILNEKRAESGSRE